MIFVTIGTQQQNFKRMFDYINKIETDEEFIIQKGKSKYALKDKFKTYDFLTYEQMKKFIKRARVVITHGGGGTIFTALREGKKVIIVPRLHKYHEHINDHQLEISEYLEKQGYCLVARNFEEFNDALEKVDSYKFKKYVSYEKEFIKNIEKEIDRLLEG